MIVDGIAALIALIHVYVFFLESILWLKPKTMRLFAVTAEEARINKVFAFNQGFYNLFLAIAILCGLLAIHVLGREEGRVLTDYGVASVGGAGLVLFFSAPRSRRAAYIQAVPALCYFLLRAAL